MFSGRETGADAEGWRAQGNGQHAAGKAGETIHEHRPVLTQLVIGSASEAVEAAGGVCGTVDAWVVTAGCCEALSPLAQLLGHDVDGGAALQCNAEQQLGPLS